MNHKSVDSTETAAVFKKLRDQVGAHNIDADIGNIDGAVVKFEHVTEFTTFLAEYAFVDGDIVVHFFPPIEHFEKSLMNGEMRVNPERLRFWKRGFPQVLSPAAEGYFNATLPRLKAAYSDEMTSWWFRAYGFAGNLPGLRTPTDFIQQFFVVLDRSLDAALAVSAPSAGR